MAYLGDAVPDGDLPPFSEDSLLEPVVIELSLDLSERPATLGHLSRQQVANTDVGQAFPVGNVFPFKDFDT